MSFMHEKCQIETSTAILVNKYQLEAIFALSEVFTILFSIKFWTKIFLVAILFFPWKNAQNHPINSNLQNVSNSDDFHQPKCHLCMKNVKLKLQQPFQSTNINWRQFLLSVKFLPFCSVSNSETKFFGGHFVFSIKKCPKSPHKLKSAKYSNSDDFHQPKCHLCMKNVKLKLQQPFWSTNIDQRPFLLSVKFLPFCSVSNSEQKFF